MLTPADVGAATRASRLGRTSPIVKLGLAIAWLIGLATTQDVRPPLVLAAIAVVAGMVLGHLPARRLLAGLGPLLVAAASIAAANLLFAAANSDPNATEIGRLGPFRLTREAADVAAGLAARILAIVSVGAVFAQTTDPTQLVDSLVQQARVPARFGYGALAAYQAAPRLSSDLQAIRAARRLRGLRTTWHPRILVGLLVRAIRHADQLAVAMDARGFDAGPRSWFRPMRWTVADAVVAAGGLAALLIALALATR